MKKLLYLLALITILPLSNSCSKEEIDFYNGADAIYFDQQYGVEWFDTVKLTRQNYSVIAFGNMDESDSIIRVKVETVGYVRNYDRPFGVEVVADSTTALNGDEYEILTANPMIAAGQNSTYITVACHRTSRMDDGENYQLQLRLVPGEHFTEIFDENGVGDKTLRSFGGDLFTEYGVNFDPMIHNIFMNCQLIAPKPWYPRWGEYSQAKMRLILDVVGAKYGWKMSNFIKGGASWMQPRTSMICNGLAKYLIEQYNKGPEYWVLDPDGTFMWVMDTRVSNLFSETDRPEDRIDQWNEQHPKN